MGTEIADVTAPLAPARRRGWLVAAGAAAVVVALYVWDDVVVSAPIIAVSAWLGPGLAFLVMTPLFFVISSALALAAVRAHDRATAGRPSRLETWLEHQVDGRRQGLARRLLRAGGAMGFVLSSILLGGTVTTWLLRYGGRRDGLATVAYASSAINAVTFVGMYSGLVSLLF